MGISYRSPKSTFLWSLFIIIFFCFSSNCYAANTITQGQVIRDGETIISASQKFELGFFSPGNSSFRYVGIWYYKIPIQSFVWVANRENPVSGEGGRFTIGNSGNLMVLDGNGNSVWSSNVSLSVESNNSTAILMDTGDLILLNGDKALWQSFGDPTDTYLPYMKVYLDVQGEKRVFTSWKSANDPSLGNYSMGVDTRGSPQIVIWDGLNRRWRSGHWNGLMFTGVDGLRVTYLYGFKLLNDGRDYFIYHLSDGSDLVRFLIGYDGNEKQLRWDEGTKNWSMIHSHPYNECEIYNRCGAFGKCNVRDSPICSCIKGFVPKNLDHWNRGNWSGGCVRRTELLCERNSSLIEGQNGEKNGFLKVEGVKLPDNLDWVGSEETGECKDICLRNCSCTAFACVSGMNCMIWNGDLVDIQHFSGRGNILYVRLANSELGDKGKLSKLVIVVIVVVGTFFLSVSMWLLWRYKTKLKAILNSWRKINEVTIFDVSRSREFSTDFSGVDDPSVEESEGTGPELALLNFNSIAAATNNFSDENKLGQGGFGPVYKGKLPGGKEIAVKRLSKKSGQGVEEFKNEISLIAKLQHRNLVRLVGCCIEGEEKMLFYEYMPNRSLDSYLFNSTKQAKLDWRKRFNIIEGIARGLLYLHRDSRLRIIHRDLKASNILLDEEMNPKISDFGMARIFGGNQNEANTNRVVGTYGYMAPEYAMEGLFSVKSDVYSFGVLLLEIISGRRNTSFRSPEYSNIIGYAWDEWKAGKGMELIDASILGTCCENEVLKCIHVAMLCVQDLASHRPTMSAVVLMLESESATLPLPRQPTFTSMRSSEEEDLWNESHDVVSSNNVTISVIVGR